MTAAHCCEGQDANSVKIVAGEHNLEENEGFEQVEHISFAHPKMLDRLSNFQLFKKF